MESYWDLYVAYVNHCVEYNKKHDIDPHHYQMEWNHFLPRCIFGDQPVGHYLLLKQHAIASALQTLAFKRNCLYSTHKENLPKELLKLAWPIYCQRSREVMVKTQASRSKEEKAESAKLANLGRTFEERSDSNKKANASRTSETRKRIATLAGQASADRTPEKRKESARKGVETKGPEVRKRIAKLAKEAWMSQSTHEQRSQLIKEGRDKLTPEERSNIIRRGWETRRRKQQGG